MKKKLIPLILVLVCAIACAFGLAACGDDGNKSVKGTIAELPEHVVEVDFENAEYAGGSDIKVVAKENEEVSMRVFFEDCYDVGTLKALINGTEIALNPYVAVDDIVEEGIYICKFAKPTAEFEITFSGAAKLAERKVTLGLSWWNYDVTINDSNTNEGQKVEEGLLKEEVKNSVYVKVLVNDEVKAPFNGITLKQYENIIATNPYITLTAKDKVEVRVYTTSADLTTTMSSIDGKVSEDEGGSLNGYGFNNLDEYIENRFDGHEKVSYLKISSCNVDEVITIVPWFYATNVPQPYGKTFVLTDIKAYVDDEQPVPDEEVMATVANLKENNLGKTAICANDGKVTGTCDFGFGALGELRGDEAFTLTADDTFVDLENNEGRSLSGRYFKGTLELSIWQWTDGEEPINYCLEFTFELQSAN